jgi:uncharacterized protein (TIGR03083 family)
MGMNRSDRDPDMLAAYALDAVDEDVALMIDAQLATSAEAASDVALLQSVAGEYAAATSSDVRPPAELRDRVLTNAFAAREGIAPAPADARDVHRLEAERFSLLARQLTQAQWEAPVDPPEFTGWTVRDLVSHVAASEALTAQLLGSPLAQVPEADTGNESRTALTQARHRDMPVDEIADELEAATRAATAVLDDLGADTVENTEVVWWGADMRLSTLCVSRAFETWTHADDIRRAVGLPQLPPPAPSLQTMSSRASEWTGLMLAVAGHDMSPTTAVLDLTGPGGGTHPIQLGLERAPSGATPAFTLRLDVVDYCAALGRRVSRDGLRYEVEGDTQLAEQLVAALPTLAQL